MGLTLLKAIQSLIILPRVKAKALPRPCKPPQDLDHYYPPNMTSYHLHLNTLAFC